ncbi:hypothetical protein EN41_25410 [Agrobacterium tumefaciens]|uniref:Uncharacterized protein n=2 Tax=Agrobacterium fabrum TaxID=1176649 RepID=A9CEI8_AGRFC|nr:conserved hypothetical protein [Agrobacterium fabrum str. C58]KEY53946.1 hypothetical protein EN41_25410 [Agrobacterium tumefaciens]TRB29625.1 hypothetical protein EXN51_07390 [Agrobacterium fabrum]
MTMSALVVPSFFYRKFLTIAALFKNNKRWRQPDEWIRVHVFFPVTSVDGERLTRVVMRRGEANNYEYRALNEEEKEEMFCDLAW